jgi:hypothetical protein
MNCAIYDDRAPREGGQNQPTRPVFVVRDRAIDPAARVRSALSPLIEVEPTCPGSVKDDRNGPEAGTLGSGTSNSA